MLQVFEIAGLVLCLTFALAAADVDGAWKAVYTTPPTERSAKAPSTSNPMAAS